MSQNSGCGFDYGIGFTQSSAPIDQSIAIGCAKLGEIRAYIDSLINEAISNAQQSLLQCQDCVNIKIDAIIRDAGEIHYLIQGKVDEQISAAISAAIEYLPYVLGQIATSGGGSISVTGVTPPVEPPAGYYQINETEINKTKEVTKQQTTIQETIVPSDYTAIGQAIVDSINALKESVDNVYDVLGDILKQQQYEQPPVQPDPSDISRQEQTATTILNEQWTTPPLFEQEVPAGAEVDPWQQG